MLILIAAYITFSVASPNTRLVSENESSLLHALTFPIIESDGLEFRAYLLRAQLSYTYRSMAVDKS